MFHFSLVHKLQTPVTGEKGAALHTTSHDTSGVMFLSFNFQICPARVVLVRCSGFSKFCLWAEYLFLKVFAVSPTYCWVSPSPLTVALYTRLFVVHFPGKGQSSGFWQLHLGGGSVLSSFKIFWLWLEILALRCWSRRMVYQPQEFCSKIRFYIQRVGRVEIDHFSVSLLIFFVTRC